MRLFIKVLFQTNLVGFKNLRGFTNNIMKNILFLFSFLNFVSCKSTTETTVAPQVSLSLQIIPDYNGSPLVMYKTYNYNGKAIQFTKFSFIVSKMCESTNSDCNNRQVQFNFSGLTDSVSALKGLTNTISVSSSNIQNLVLGFGVDGSANGTIPAKQPQSSPLANGLNYWEAWDSYIFLSVQGMYDNDGNGTLETPFAFDTGGNEVYSEKIILLNNYIPNPTATSVNLLFNVNLSSVLNTMDFNVITQTSKFVDIPVMKVLMKNLQNSLIYKGISVK